MANLGDMVVKIVGDATEFNKAIDASEKRFTDATSNFTKLGKNLTTFVTLPVLALGAAMVKSAADMEMLEADFTTLLGSSKKAKVMLDALADAAARTPFELTDLARSTKTMLAFGISAEKVLPNLQMLGDIAGGNADKLNSLTLAFSQISSTGRLTGQDLLQLINAGFNPLTIISQKTGETMIELKKRMEQGGVSAIEVSDAFKTATSEGGLFFGGMERASKTFTGQLSTLKDNAAALARSFGEELLPIMINILQSVSGAVESFSALDRETKQTILRTAALAATVGPAILVILKMADGLNKLNTTFKFMGVVGSGPIALVIAGIVALSAAILVFSNNVKKGQEEFNKLKLVIEGGTTGKVAEDLAAVNKELIYLKDLQSASTGLWPEQDKALQAQIDKLVTIKNKLVEQYRAQGQTAQGAKAIADASALEVAAETELSAAIALRSSTSIVANDTEVAQVATITDAVVVETEAVVAQASAYTSLYDERTTKEIDWQALQNIGVTNTLSGFAAIGAAFVDGESGWKAFAKAGVLAIASVLDALGAQLAAMAVLNFASKPPNIVGGIKAAIGSAAAYVAAGAVRASAAQLAEGGIVMPTEGGTLAQIAEAGQPEAVIPLDKLGSMGGQMHLVVNLDSRPLLDKIFDATKNRTVLISQGAVV